ncbi:MAG: hypothetical protein D6677_08520 [Calditrichaeota bacterium]|nr:MAG: hypothetical protein D6677_08520 [Calditrichota bacterium]
MKEFIQRELFYQKIMTATLNLSVSQTDKMRLPLPIKTFIDLNYSIKTQLDETGNQPFRFTGYLPEWPYPL